MQPDEPLPALIVSISVALAGLLVVAGILGFAWVLVR